MFTLPYLNPYYFYLYKYANNNPPPNQGGSGTPTPATGTSEGKKKDDPSWIERQLSSAYEWAKQNPLKTFGISVGAVSTAYALYSLINALRKKSKR